MAKKRICTKVTFANTSLSRGPEEFDLARSEGRVEISFGQSKGISRLKHLFQSGCGRVRFPSVDHVDTPEAVLINTSGGLTGGDRMDYDILVEENAKLTVSGQAAEKIYKSIGPDVIIETTMRVQEGAHLEWLPQETILFDKARLRRLNKVELSSECVFLALEATILGRRAHGECLTDASLVDGWKIWRDGKLIWFDQFRLSGDMDTYLAKPALLGGATAFATIILVCPDIPKYVKLLRDEQENYGSKVGVTAFDDGLLVLRVMDEEAYGLRLSLVTILNRLRNELAEADIAMPAVWEV